MVPGVTELENKANLTTLLDGEWLEVRGGETGWRDGEQQAWALEAAQLAHVGSRQAGTSTRRAGLACAALPPHR